MICRRVSFAFGMAGPLFYENSMAYIGLTWRKRSSRYSVNKAPLAAALVAYCGSAKLRQKGCCRLETPGFPVIFPAYERGEFMQGKG